MGNSTLNIHDIKDNAEKWTRAAKEYINDQMKTNFSINTKAHQHDLVTDVDKNVEKFFLEKITYTYPNHRVMGEEGSFESVKDLDGVVWILDPIDGTINFVQQKCYFAISIGIFENGVPLVGIVYDVAGDEMFISVKGEGATLNSQPIAQLTKTSLDESLLSFNAGWMLEERKLERLVMDSRGIRSYGVAALEIAYVACGRLEAYISFNLAPWDIAGGYAILQEVGGKATNYSGKKLTFLGKDTFFAANPWVYEEIREKLED